MKCTHHDVLHVIVVAQRRECDRVHEAHEVHERVLEALVRRPRRLAAAVRRERLHTPRRS